MNRQDVIDIINKAKKENTQPDLSELDLSNLDLSGLNFDRAVLRESNLAGADLSGTGLHRADMSHTDLTNAVLKRANMSHVDLTDACMKGANAAEAKMSKADLHWVDATGACFDKAFMRWTDMTETDLTKASLRDADLTGANLDYPILHRVDATGARFNQASLKGVDLGDINLNGSSFSKANLDCSGALTISGLPSGHLSLVPTPSGWLLNVGCKRGVGLGWLRFIVESDNEKDWPEARGEEIAVRRPSLVTALAQCEDHAARNAGLIESLAVDWPDTIPSDKNLPREDNRWVHGTARVYDDVIVRNPDVARP